MEKYVDKILPHQFAARRSSDRCLLSLNDRVQHVLNDNESIEIGEISVPILIYDVFLI
jgi:hypothetical protein